MTWTGCPSEGNQFSNGTRRQSDGQPVPAQQRVLWQLGRQEAFDGESGFPLGAWLRPGKAHPSWGAVEALGEL
jgi:hypothetical protein